MDSGPSSIVLDSGDGIESSGSTGGHSADPGPPACENRSPLEKDLERQLDRATALEQADRRVEVDVVARGEDDCRLGVVPRTLERLVTPLLDSIALGHVYELEFCRRHSAALRLGDRCHSPIRPIRRIGRPLSGGIALRRGKRSVKAASEVPAVGLRCRDDTHDP